MDETDPVATSEVSKKISAISKETVHHICSGQVRIKRSVKKTTDGYPAVAESFWLVNLY